MNRLRALAGTGRGLQLAAAALLAIALLAACVYIASPYWAVSSLRAAAREQDGAALVASVDVQAVGDSLKTQLARLLAEAEAQAPQPGTANAVIGRVGPAVAGAMAGPLVDTLLTAEGIEAFLRSDAAPGRDLLFKVQGPKPPSALADAPEAQEQPKLPWFERIESRSFRSPRSFAVRLEGGWTLYLTLHGLRWRVDDVAIPADLFES